MTNKGMDRMKEKAIEKLLAELIRTCGLGEIIEEVEAVSGECRSSAPGIK